MGYVLISILKCLAMLLFICFGVQALHNMHYVTISSDIGSKNDSFLYAECESSLSNCNVSIDRVSMSNVQSCSVKLLGSSEMNNLIELRNLDNDNVIMTWMSFYDQANDMHIGILNMSDCSLSHFKYTFNENMEVFPVLYKNGFDIFVEKNETMCAGATSLSCRVSFDMEGRRIGEPVPFGIDMQMSNVWAIAADTPDKGLFVNGYETVRESNNNIGMKLVEPTGKVVDLLMDKKAVTGHIGTLFPAVSNAHEYFGMCWRSPSDELDCMQFDAAGSVRLNVSVPTLPTEELLLGAHNLAEGEMLAVTVLEHRVREDNAFRIRKIGTSGVLGEVRKVSHPCHPPDALRWMHIAESEKELIFYFSCWGYEMRGRDLVDASVLRLPRTGFIS